MPPNGKQNVPNACAETNESGAVRCNREDAHPGLHHDRALNVYWTPGAPKLEYVSVP